ncbi:NYN domain-containing protein [Oligoflexia bacterium]|nr:NYN domain-containing protein [Oligoflexia bacterium]
MGRSIVSYDKIGKGIVKRRERRVLGLFIDGTGLDRATRRLHRKVDMPRLVRGVTSGMTPVVARYYTLIPYEDDSRQRAFLDAVRRAGLRVVVKRLPPKGVTRQVSVDIEMSADIVAFALGHQKFSSLSEYLPAEAQEAAAPNSMFKGPIKKALPGPRNVAHQPISAAQETDRADSDGEEDESHNTNIQRVVTVVCPGRDLAYPVSLVKELGVDTVTADFGQFNNQDILKSAAKWIDLSDSETIWRE